MNTPQRARTIVDEIAARLADPQRVITLVTSPDNIDRARGSAAWGRLSLSEGCPGVALLYAELGHHWPQYRPVAHAWLTAATHQFIEARPYDSLYCGVPAFAFALRAAAHAGDYATALTHLDAAVIDRTRATIATERQRLDARQAGARIRTYDVISGLTGLGAYLLQRGTPDSALIDTLTCLIHLTEPVRAHEHWVPGWWSPDNPTPGTGHYPRGHYNLGLAHGIAGPLALLALAWQDGVRLPNHAQAIERIVEWLLSWRRASHHGRWWPAIVTLDDDITGPPLDTAPTRPVWCYGTAGVARALQLAGIALNQPDWGHVAIESLHAALVNQHTRRITDSSLCHGWAGLLHITWRMAQDSGDARLTTHLPQLANHLIEGFDASSPFGIQRLDQNPPLDQAGFLEGAAGVALALHTFASDTHPISNWDAALLLT